MKQQLIDWLRRPENANKSVEQIVKNIEELDLWISVDERLPEVNKDVTVFCKDGSIHTGTYHTTYWVVSKYFSWDVSEPTHWQPLPEKPKQT